MKPYITIILFKHNLLHQGGKLTVRRNTLWAATLQGATLLYPYAEYIPVEGNKCGRLILGFGFRKFTRANNGVCMRWDAEGVTDGR